MLLTVHRALRPDLPAEGLAEFMFEKGLAQAEQPCDTRAWIEGQLYKPQY